MSLKDQVWSARMPSNIALIKYMGKKEGEGNRPSNSSLSWTLGHLYSEVQVQVQGEAEGDTWEPLETAYPIALSSVGLTKFLKHVARIKEHFGVQADLLIRSGNNFPSDCGIASSASSFAALTQAVSLACVELSQQTIPEPSVLANLSAQGSGSSCRSFFPGWVKWEEGHVQPVSSPYSDVLHMVVLVGDQVKAVSSSQAHQRVSTSLLNHGRTERAELRLSQFMKAMESADWKSLYELGWADSWDMHALFETSQPPFGYFLPDSLKVLFLARQLWNDHGDGPLVTMDAGPNVHLLWRADQKEMALEFFKQQIQGQWSCLSHLQEIGFARV